MRNITKSLSVILILIVFTSYGCFAFSESDFAITSKGACVMDFYTGEILFGYNQDTQLVPASLTKLITVYCVYNAIERGDISLYDIVPISEEMEEKALKCYYEDYFPLYRDKTYTVDDLISAALVRSSNCAAVVLSEYVSGTEEQFVDTMKTTMDSLGIKGEFYDCHGLSNDNRVSPYEYLRFVRILLSEYPEILNKTSLPYIELHGRRFNSTNLLLDKFYYEGADGLKSGTTTAAGYCFCATAKRENRRVLSLTMFSESADDRFIDSVKLLDLGFEVLTDNESIFNSDIKASFDETKIPAYYYRGKSGFAVIKADDLSICGFDLCFSEKDRTLYISYNQNKKKEQIDFNKTNYTGIYSDVTPTDIRVAFVENGIINYIENSFNSKGNMMISIDELAEYFQYNWDSDKRLATFILQ